ncbi:MAG: SUMF1/EgtB/PvdO family nonheme iron enzyme [Chloroflexi bacterium]|nr:SUMF1/EgtB/PvdO family nonheme iron enzyme [Chloroflexota bacterium]
MSDVFISYSRLDRDFVGKLREALADQKQDVWIDWESIPPSQAWWDEIQKGIARANNFVVVLSPNSLASPICQMEIEAARQLGKRIIPVLHLDYNRDDAIKAMALRLAAPDQDAARRIWGNRQPHNLYDANDSVLKHINYFFFRPEDDFSSRFTALMGVIRTDFDHKERHTIYELRALEWDHRQRNVSFLLLDDELAGAQEWLCHAQSKEPSPTTLHHEYIQASEKRTRQLRSIRRASIIGSAVAVLALIFAVAASMIGVQATNSANDAGTREANASVRESTALAQVGTATVVQGEAERRAEIAGTQIADANATLRPIPNTLEAANTQVVAAATAQSEAENRAAAADTQVAFATATLGYVQNQGTDVAAQATYFGIQQARIGTLAAGAVVLPLSTETLEPTQFVATLTAIAILSEWEPVDMTDDFSVQMVLVPPGCFYMGSVAGGNQQPVHIQCFDEPFWIDKYEVTNVQYRKLTGSEPPSVFDDDLNPVDSIDWFEARDYCQLRGARLPTEREWEYAARGPNSLTYPWGNEFIESAVVYNRPESAGPLPVLDTSGRALRPEGASWVGALDMAGNVWEWTSTRYDDLLDDSDQIFDLQGLYPYPYVEDDGRESDETYNEFVDRIPIYTTRVLRGGSYGDADHVLTSALRGWYSPHVTGSVTGLRCARSFS